MSLRHRLGGQFPAVTLARRNISRAKVRSALAIAAVVIGVVAIGAIGAGGAAFKQAQLDTVRDQGANNVFVFPGVDKPQRYFDREDLLALQETVGSAGTVATQSGSMELVKRAGRRETVSVTYLDDPRQVAPIRAGSVPDNWRQSVVLDHEFAARNGFGPGDRIKLIQTRQTSEGSVESQRTYRVVAVLEETQIFGVGQVMLPIEEAEHRRFDRVRVTTRSVDDAEIAAQAIRDEFNDRKDVLLVLELTALVRFFKAIVNGINIFLAGLGSISLLVAGVSIANTMLMAVLKRRQEIGVLRAVGYSKRDILRILLVEATLLGVIGALVGAAIATGVAAAANVVFLGDPLAFTPTAILYLVGAIAVGILISLIAGIYPAWRAANEQPVDVLRG